MEMVIACPSESRAEAHVVALIAQTDQPPDDRQAAIQSAQVCRVKNHIDHPPVVGIGTTVN